MNWLSIYRGHTPRNLATLLQSFCLAKISSILPCLTVSLKLYLHFIVWKVTSISFKHVVIEAHHFCHSYDKVLCSGVCVGFFYISYGIWKVWAYMLKIFFKVGNFFILFTYSDHRILMTVCFYDVFSYTALCLQRSFCRYLDKFNWPCMFLLFFKV